MKQLYLRRSYKKEGLKPYNNIHNEFDKGLSFLWKKKHIYERKRGTKNDVKEIADGWDRKRMADRYQTDGKRNPGQIR